MRLGRRLDREECDITMTVKRVVLGIGDLYLRVPRPWCEDNKR